ncbi:MAG: DHH family phosphoesterase [Lactiplantibacillus plantarum]
MKTSAIITAITKSIVKMDRILVYRHTNPDPDAIGAQFGLVALLKAAYPEKLVVAMAPVPGHLAWIDTTDEQLVTPPSNGLSHCRRLC